MKIIVTAFLLLFISACKVDVSPQFAGSSYTTDVYEAFEGIRDGVPTVYQYGDGYYTCNSIDLFVYIVHSGASVLNTDSSQVTCSIDLFTYTNISQDERLVAPSP